MYTILQFAMLPGAVLLTEHGQRALLIDSDDNGWASPVQRLIVIALGLVVAGLLVWVAWGRRPPTQRTTDHPCP
jgi:hypothetical protein